MLSLFSAGGLSPEDAARLRRVERKLDLLLEHLGLESAPGLPEEVRRLADAGQKIEAIKAHRQHFGSGLVEAKEAVEEYMAGR